jgi:hypothetical protein
MNKLVKVSLVLAAVCGAASCGKKEEKKAEPEPPVVAEEKGFLSAAKDKASEIGGVAADKASEIKDTTGEALGKAVESVKDFGSRTSETVREKLPGSDE